MRAAGRNLTQPAPRPTGRRRGKGGAGGKAITRNVAREIAEDYLRLCQNPARDVLRWLAEDRKRPGRIRITITSRAGRNDAASRRETFRKAAHGLRRDPLPPVRHGLDTYRQGGRGADYLPARQGESAGKYGGLRQVRAAVEGLTRRASQDHSRLAARFGAEADGIAAEFRRKLAALRGRVTPLEMAAAVRVLQDERDAALRALRERRAVERYGKREAARLAGGRPREGPL